MDDTSPIGTVVTALSSTSILLLISPALFSAHISMAASLRLAYHLQPAGNSVLPPITILHGLFGSKTNWRSIAKRLSQKLNRHVSYKHNNLEIKPGKPELFFLAALCTI